MIFWKFRGITEDDPGVLSKVLNNLVMVVIFVKLLEKVRQSKTLEIRQH